jgi:hypothetical protein
MKITLYKAPNMTFEEFMDQHDLELEVHETVDNQFIVFFKDVQIKTGHISCHHPGRGRTLEKAIKNYVSNINQKMIIFGIGTSKCRFIKVPNLKMLTLEDLLKIITEVEKQRTDR